MPNGSLIGVYQALMKAGNAFDLTHFGLYATESMRLEKGYRHWKADLITEFNPVESGLERFVSQNKNFHGKAGVERQLAKGLRKRFVSLLVDANHAPTHPGDSIVAGGKVIGSITSAGWGYRLGRNLAMGFVDPGFADIGTRIEVEVIGEPVAAVVCEPCQYDPGNALVRG